MYTEPKYRETFQNVLWIRYFYQRCFPADSKVQLGQEMEELKQSKKELEVRMNALKCQYEGRLHRLDRELRELRDVRSHHSELSEEPQDHIGVKVL